MRTTVPEVTDLIISTREVRLVTPFVTSRDAVPRTATYPIVVDLIVDEVHSYCGECVPVQYITGETAESVVSDLQGMATAIRGLSVTSPAPIVEAISGRWSGSPSARAGLEMALWRSVAAQTNTNMWTLFGGTQREIETDLTLSITRDAARLAAEAEAEGFRIFKVKVGGADPTEEIARLHAVVAAAPGCVLRIDANQAFTPEQAVVFAEQCVTAGLPIQLLEQPVAARDIQGLHWVVQRSPIPIVADEAVRTTDEAEAALQAGVHAINIKLMKSGISGALAIIQAARAAGVLLMVGCMLETRVGISAALALAAGSGAFSYFDLDSHRLVNEINPPALFEDRGPLLIAGSYTPD